MLEEYIQAHLSTSTALTTLISTRLYPIRMPQDAGYPAIVYETEMKKQVMCLSGRTDLYNQQVQLDVCAKTYNQSKVVANILEQVMEAAKTYNAVPQSAQDVYEVYESGLEIYRVRLVFSCWVKNT